MKFHSCACVGLDWSPSHLRAWMVEQGLAFKEEEISLFEGLCSLNRIFLVCFASLGKSERHTKKTFKLTYK